jgi:hypothetical protein
VVLRLRGSTCRPVAVVNTKVGFLSLVAGRLPAAFLALMVLAERLDDNGRHGEYATGPLRLGRAEDERLLFGLNMPASQNSATMRCGFLEMASVGQGASWAMRPDHGIAPAVAGAEVDRMAASTHSLAPRAPQCDYSTDSEPTVFTTVSLEGQINELRETSLQCSS